MKNEKDSKPELADIFREFGEAYRKKYKTPQSHIKIMNLIKLCRTSALGGHIEKCDKCGYEIQAYNSCSNRHCPKCQRGAKEKWLENRKKELLPVGYYHIVFTIPSELNQLTLKHKRIVYNILFKSASETLLTLAKDPKHIGAEIGILAILHTWGQNLMEHPHMHCVVPQGGLSQDGKKWLFPKKAKHRDFFIHVNIISDLFKKKFLFYLKKANKEKRFAENENSASVKKLIDELYFKKWITYCKRPFASAAIVFEYLARYTHKVAISNNRIKRIENGKVAFEWKDYRTGNQKKEMVLDALEFIRRFMLHILPEGFCKIRYYGILSSRKKKKLIEKSLELLKDKKYKIKNLQKQENKEWFCPKCKKGKITVIKIFHRQDISMTGASP